MIQFICIPESLVQNAQIRAQSKVGILALLLEMISGAQTIDAVVADDGRKAIVFIHLEF